MNKKIFKFCTFALCCFGFSSPSFSEDKKPLETVAYVDLNRYLGEWFEIASFYQRFQKDCVASKATYTLKDAETINVFNECRLKSFDGKVRNAKGVAKVVDKNTNSKLKVSFFWPFYGKYWIIDLGKDYEYAVVGHPSREYLWILSRTPQMDEAKLDGLRSKIKDMGYDLTKLNMTPQP